MDNKIILEYSNSKIRQLKKSELVQALIGLKKVCKEVEVASDIDKMGIELLDAKTENEELKATIIKLQDKIVNYKNEVRILNKKQKLSSIALGELNEMINNLKYELNNRPWWMKIFN